MTEQKITATKPLSEQDKEIVEKYMDKNIMHMLDLDPKIVTNQEILDLFSMKDMFRDVKNNEDIKKKILYILENGHQVERFRNVADSIYNKAKKEYPDQEETEHSKEAMGWTQEEVDIHKSRICELGIDTPQHVEKMIDAILLHPDLVKKMLGNDIYEVMKNNNSLKKTLYTDISDQEIEGMSDFQIYLGDLVKQKIRKIKYEFEQKNKTEIELSKEIKNINQDIAELEKELAKIKKADFRFVFISDIDPNIQKAINIFLKKYTYKNENYSIEKVIDMKIHVQNKTNKEIKNLQQESNRNKPKIENLHIDEYQIQQELLPKALIDFKEILVNTGNDFVYGTNDIHHMQNIAHRFENKLDTQTDIEIPIEKLQQENLLAGNIVNIGEAGDVIGVNRHNFFKIDEYKQGLKQLENMNLRSVIFNRIIEYVMMDQNSFGLNRDNKKNIQFTITKSNIMDDVFSGTDYIVDFKDGDNEYVALVDMMIGFSKEAIKSKQEKSSEPKIAYNYRINRGCKENALEKDHTKRSYELPKVKRIVDVYPPSLAYKIVQETITAIETKGTNGLDKNMLEKFDDRINHESSKSKKILIGELEKEAVVLS